MDWPNFKITDDCLTVYDSYKVSKKDFNTYLDTLRQLYDVKIFKMRSNKSLTNEWSCHNFVHMIGLFRSRTQNSDMQYPLTWWEKIVYPGFGWFCKLFIK